MLGDGLDAGHILHRFRDLVQLRQASAGIDRLRHPNLCNQHMRQVHRHHIVHILVHISHLLSHAGLNIQYTLLQIRTLQVCSQ